MSLFNGGEGGREGSPKPSPERKVDLSSLTKMERGNRFDPQRVTYHVDAHGKIILIDDGMGKNMYVGHASQSERERVQANLLNCRGQQDEKRAVNLLKVHLLNLKRTGVNVYAPPEEDLAESTPDASPPAASASAAPPLRPSPAAEAPTASPSVGLSSSSGSSFANVSPGQAADSFDISSAAGREVADLVVESNPEVTEERIENYPREGITTIFEGGVATMFICTEGELKGMQVPVPFMKKSEFPVYQQQERSNVPHDARHPIDELVYRIALAEHDAEKGRELFAWQKELGNIVAVRHNYPTSLFHMMTAADGTVYFYDKKNLRNNKSVSGRSIKRHEKLKKAVVQGKISQRDYDLCLLDAARVKLPLDRGKMGRFERQLRADRFGTRFHRQEFSPLPEEDPNLVNIHTLAHQLEEKSNTPTPRPRQTGRGLMVGRDSKTPIPVPEDRDAGPPLISSSVPVEADADPRLPSRDVPAALESVVERTSEVGEALKSDVFDLEKVFNTLEKLGVTLEEEHLPRLTELLQPLDFRLPADETEAKKVRRWRQLAREAIVKEIQDGVDPENIIHVLGHEYFERKALYSRFDLDPVAMKREFDFLLTWVKEAFFVPQIMMIGCSPTSESPVNVGGEQQRLLNAESAGAPAIVLNRNTDVGTKANFRRVLQGYPQTNVLYAISHGLQENAHRSGGLCLVPDSSKGDDGLLSAERLAAMMDELEHPPLQLYLAMACEQDAEGAKLVELKKTRMAATGRGKLPDDEGTNFGSRFPIEIATGKHPFLAWLRCALAATLRIEDPQFTNFAELATLERTDESTLPRRRKLNPGANLEIDEGETSVRQFRLDIDQKFAGVHPQFVELIQKQIEAAQKRMGRRSGSSGQNWREGSIVFTLHKEDTELNNQIDQLIQMYKEPLAQIGFKVMQR